MNTKLISAIDVQFLIHKYNSNFTETTNKLDEFGATYQYQDLSNDTNLFFQIALYENTTLAIKRIEQQKIMTSIGSTVSDQSIGDSYDAWIGPDPLGGGILFRRMNAVFHISGKIDFNQKKLLATFIDKAITNHHQKISYSDSILIPQVLLKDFDGTAYIGSKPAWSIDVLNINTVGLKLEVNNTHSIIDQKTNLLKYFVGTEPKRDIINILVWQPSNVFSIHPFNVIVLK